MKFSLVFVLFLIPAIANAQDNQAEKVYEKVNDAVVRIYSYNSNKKIQGQGSGVVLKSKRWVITNAHVARSGKLLFAEHEGIFFELDSIIVQDIQADILVLRIKENKENDELKDFPDISIFDSDKIKIGQRIFTIGSPLDFENTISEGIVSGIRRSGHDSTFKILQISAPISQGSSGGAVLDAKGRLVGITTSVMSGEAVQNINFAIPINKVFDVVNRKGGKNNVPLSFDSCYKKANEEMEIRHYDHALVYFKKAVELNPGNDYDNLLLKYMIGQCFVKLYEPDSAIVYLESALKSEAKKFCYYYLGKAWMQKKNYEKAEKAFQSAIDADPNYIDAYNGMTLLFIKQNQLLPATDWARKSIQVNKDNPETFYLTARLLFMTGKYDDAIETLNNLLKWKPNYADAIYFLAGIYLEKNETEKSFLLQQRAFELKPELRYIPIE